MGWDGMGWGRKWESLGAGRIVCIEVKREEGRIG